MEWAKQFFNENLYMRIWLVGAGTVGGTNGRVSVGVVFLGLRRRYRPKNFSSFPTRLLARIGTKGNSHISSKKSAWCTIATLYIWFLSNTFRRKCISKRNKLKIKKKGSPTADFITEFSGFDYNLLPSHCFDLASLDHEGGSVGTLLGRNRHNIDFLR